MSLCKANVNHSFLQNRIPHFDPSDQTIFTSESEESGFLVNANKDSVNGKYRLIILGNY